MYKDIKFKKINWFQKLSPQMREVKALTKSDTIYLSDDLYAEVMSGKPSVYVQGIIEHEKVHMQRKQEMGACMFKLKYSFSPQFRLREELLAETARFSFLKSKGEKINLEDRARKMSGFMYFWMISYTEALKLLEDLWENC